MLDVAQIGIGGIQTTTNNIYGGECKKKMCLICALISAVVTAAGAAIFQKCLKACSDAVNAGDSPT